MLAILTDRSLPLAERVNAAYLVGIQVADGDENGQDARAALDGLRADVAAADRLARAADALDADDWSMVDEEGVPLVADVHIAALDAYRARMQGVACG